MKGGTQLPINPRRVYCSNYGGHNMKAAVEEFGKDNIIFLTEGTINVFSVDRLYYDLTKKLVDFTEQDLLLVSGSPIINMVITDIILSKGIRPFNVLIYHASAGKYLPRRIGGIGSGGGASDYGQAPSD